MIEQTQVLATIAEFLDQPPEKLGDDALLTDLVTQSFVLVELVIELQEAFGVRFGQDELKSVRTVGDLSALIQSLGPP